MKGAVLYGAHQPLVVEELHLLPPQAGEVRVVGASGVCHSDLHYIKGTVFAHAGRVRARGCRGCRRGGARRHLCQTRGSCYSVAGPGLRTLCDCVAGRRICVKCAIPSTAICPMAPPGCAKVIKKSSICRCLVLCRIRRGA
jgi:hypothetical protein